jgi:hypothetical protein
MENTTTEENKPLAREIAQVPAETGAAIKDGAETVAHDLETGAAEGVTILAGATKAVVSDIAEAAKQLGRDAKQAVSSAPEPEAIAVAPVA